jgi:hypothetical protein
MRMRCTLSAWSGQRVTRAVCNSGTLFCFTGPTEQFTGAAALPSQSTAALLLVLRIFVLLFGYLSSRGAQTSHSHA